MIRFDQCTISANHIKQTNILDPIHLDFNEQTNAKPCDTFQHPDHDILFSHSYIATELDKFGLTLEGCSICSPVTKHFADPRSLVDKLAEEQIIWVKFPNAIMKNPAPHLSRPIFDPCILMSNFLSLDQEVMCR